MSDFNLLQSLDRRVAGIDSRRDANNHVLADATAKHRDALDRIDLYDRVIVLFRRVIDSGLKKSFESIETLVTEGLTTVYGEDRLELKIVPVERKGGQFNVQITTRDKIRNLEGPTQDTFGGAVVQIESFLLRLMFVLQTKMIRFLVLDESFNCVGSNFLGNLVDLLKELCKKFNLDILLITHQKEVQEGADMVFEVQDSGKGLVLK